MRQSSKGPPRAAVKGLSRSTLQPSSEAGKVRARANRPERLLRTAMQTLKMIARGARLPDILTSVCIAIDAENPGIISTVLLMDPDGTQLWPTAGPRVPAGWTRAISPLKVAPDMGSCGTAAFRKEPVIISDIATDPRWSAAPPEQSREVAISYGLRAAWSTPLLSKGDQVLGTFALYYGEPRSPDLGELRLIEDASYIALTAIEVEQSRKALERAVVHLTERRRVEQVLRERERETLLILDAIPALVAILAPTGEVVTVNHELEAFCGQPVEVMREWGTNGTVHADDLPHIVPIFTGAIASGEPYDFEARIRRFDGVYRWLQVRGLPLRDSSGQIVRWYVLLSDVDDRKRAEQAIDNARSELARVARVMTLSALTASIAHEVNQPLSGIITNAGTCLRMLDAIPPDIDGARDTAKRTIRDGHRASDVITRLRALFSKREFILESVDLNDATREVVALSRNDLQRNGVALQMELAEPLPLVVGDRIQLQQVILNLLRNASEAMVDVDDRSRQLVIQTLPEGDTGVRVTVRDAGIGLDRQSIEKLFDAFYTTKQGGMGIGLSVSRSIIERHHGRMWAEPNDGPGATFVFSIPLA
jgi:PAS domain S-box-containing protein